MNAETLNSGIGETTVLQAGNEANLLGATVFLNTTFSGYY
jgi:hypothetical protein